MRVELSKVPESAILKEPFRMGSSRREALKDGVVEKLPTEYREGPSMREARRAFWRLALERIVYRDINGQNAQYQTLFGQERGVFGRGPYKELKTNIHFLVLATESVPNSVDKKEYPEKILTALEISINEELIRLFDSGNENYTVLIPYIIEQEIYHAWLWAKSGFSPNETTRLLLSLVRGFEVAFADPDYRAELLLKFYLCLSEEKKYQDLVRKAYVIARKRYERYYTWRCSKINEEYENFKWPEGTEFSDDDYYD